MQALRHFTDAWGVICFTNTPIKHTSLHVQLNIGSRYECTIYNIDLKLQYWKVWNVTSSVKHMFEGYVNVEFGAFLGFVMDMSWGLFKLFQGCAAKSQNVSGKISVKVEQLKNIGYDSSRL